jgi:hypothetical protein
LTAIKGEIMMSNIMKTALRFFCVLAVLSFCCRQGAAAPSATNSPMEFRLTVELQDGSRVVGKGGDENFLFKSDILGEIKLPLAKIRSMECQPGTNSVKLTAANGDTLAVKFAMKEIRVETAFGKLNLAVDSIKSVKVSISGGEGKIRPGMVALWSGEGNADDAAGENNGVLEGDVGFAPGKAGQGFLFNNENVYIKIPASSSLDVGAGNGLTIELWISPTDVSIQHPLVEFDSSTPGGVVGAFIWISTGGFGGGPGCLIANLNDTTGTPHILSSPAGIVNANVFQHVAVTYDKATGYTALYCNGAVVATANLGVFTPKTSTDLLFGHRGSTGESYLGVLDEVGLYNRALSASEIQAICMEENNGEPLPPPHPSSPIRMRPPFNGGF